MYDNICRELKLILGGGPGAKKKCEASEVLLEASFAEDGVYV